MAAKFDLDEVVAIQVVRGLEGEVRAHAHGHGADHGITDVEIVMQVARGDTSDDAVVRIIGRIWGQLRGKGAAHFHAGEDAINAMLISPFHAL